MTTKLLHAFLSLGIVLLSGFYSHVVAGKIELDNSSTTTASNNSDPITFRLAQFSRFSLDGPTVRTSFGSSGVFTNQGDTRVSLFSLSDYGITNQNIGQLGSLLQIQFNVLFSPTAGGSAQVTLFLIDPNTLQQIVVGGNSIGVQSLPGSAVFSVSQFGALPQNITPDFYIGVRGSVSVFPTSVSAGSSTLTILSTVPTPEPVSLVLLASGLSSAGLLGIRRRRKQKQEPKNPRALQ